MKRDMKNLNDALTRDGIRQSLYMRSTIHKVDDHFSQIVYECPYQHSSIIKALGNCQAGGPS